MSPTIENKATSLYTSNIVLVLKTFSKEEIRDFDKFVRSPFFNNRSEVTRYFQVLKKYHPSFDQKDFNKEAIYKKLYPEKSYKDDVMRRLNSNLFKLAEDYFAVSKVDKYEFPYSVSMLHSLSEHNLDEQFRKAYNNLVTAFKKEKISNDTFEIRLTYENVFVDHNLFMSRQHNIVSNAVDCGIYHIMNFFAQLPIYYNDLLINKNVFNYDPGQNLIEKLMSNFNFTGFLQEIDFSQNEYLKILPVYVYQLLLTHFPDNELYFYEYKTHVLKHKDIFDSLEYNLHLQRLQDYCTVKIQDRESKFLKEYHSISRLIVDENVFKYLRNIPLTHFFGIVDISLSLNDVGFAEKFITTYGSKLINDIKKDALNLFNAKVFFHKHQLDLALKEINKVRYAHPPIQTWAKFLLTKIYYEMDYSELLHSHVDTFRHYVANNKTITEERKNKIRKFLNNVLKLARLKIDRDFTELAEIKKSLTKENDMISWGHKYWLLEKLKEIEDTN